MGWLTPEENLIDPEFRPDWAHLRERPAGDAPAGTAVTALGRQVHGLRIDGAVVEPSAEIALDAAFEVCPVPEMLGVPLMAKRLPLSDAREEPNHPMRSFVLNRLMTAPGMGLPMAWAAAGPSAQLPPVLLARGDGMAFGLGDLECLQEFFKELEEECPPDEHARRYTPAEFRAWIVSWTRCMALDESRDVVPAFADLEPALEIRLPVGVRVKASGLSKAELNGKTGFVRKYDAAKGRVGVEFAKPHGLLSLRPDNLVLEAAARRRALLAENEKKKKK